MTMPRPKQHWIYRMRVGGKSRSALAVVLIAWTLVVISLSEFATPAVAQQEPGNPSADSPAPTVGSDQETDRQKEQRLAVEQERAARGTSVKDLKTKLAEAENSTSGDPLQLTFDDLVFPMDKNDNFKRSMLSKEHDKLDQRRVSISGYIRPSARQSGLDKFVFVRDNMQCCFGPGAALYDCILVKLADGKSTDYTVRPVTIEGDFYIKEFTGPNGKTWAIFRMKNGQVK